MKNKIILTISFSLITIILSTTKLGYIPIPTTTNWATLMHIPAIIAGILGGWVVGMIIGVVFGITAIIVSTINDVGMFADPFVSLPPRIIIGVVSYFVFIWTKNINAHFGIVLASAIGSFSHTFVILTILVMRGWLDAETAVRIGLTIGIPELIVATFVCLVAITGVWLFRDKYILSQ